MSLAVLTSTAKFANVQICTELNFGRGTMSCFDRAVLIRQRVV